ncbi:hypothetical protein N7931_17535 [Catenovulum sp. 2E275]|uniref:hypothetical protein n=1 Tax=Catenovulum sp. 2E275 TaxID=2980497 RepID=UPI0021D0D5C8|nr:hypothetical protein [Catenovulum sp. 2E275]MCU4677429.1 hypothetical protein [Catenovulum sp. 2E275]
MLEIANKIADAIQSGNILWLAVILMVGLIGNYPRISEYLEGRKRQRIKRIMEALDCTHLDDQFKDFLKHELSREYFLYVAQIPAEKEYREELIRLHKLSKGELPFLHFRRASRHLKFEGGQVAVNLDLSDKIGYYMNFAVSIFFGLVALVMFMMPAFVQPISFVQALSLYGLGALFVVMVIFFLSQTFSVYSAKRIKSHIAEIYNNQLNDDAASGAC